MRLFLGLLFTPLVTSLIFAGFPFLVNGHLPTTSEFILLLTPSYFVTLTGLIAFGLPIVLGLKKLKKLNYFTLLFLGSLAGIIFFILFSLVLSEMLGSENAVNVVSILWGLSMGFVTALFFALMTGITNDSKSEKVGI